jgi:hypothetical protein
VSAQFAMVPAWLLRQCHDARAVQLYGLLCLYARDRLASPDADALARDLRCSQRSAERALQKLRRSGAVRTTARRGADGLFRGCDVTLAGVDGPLSALTDQPPQVAAGLEGTNRHGWRQPTATGGGPTDLDLIKAREDLKAGASHPVRPVEHRNDAPTDAQFRKLVYAVWDEEGFSSEADLAESVKSQAAQLRGFDYAADIKRLHRAIASVVGHRLNQRGTCA